MEIIFFSLKHCSNSEFYLINFIEKRYEIFKNKILIEKIYIYIIQRDCYTWFIFYYLYLSSFLRLELENDRFNNCSFLKLLPISLQIYIIISLQNYKRYNARFSNDRNIGHFARWKLVRRATVRSIKYMAVHYNIAAKRLNIGYTAIIFDLPSHFIISPCF